MSTADHLSQSMSPRLQPVATDADGRFVLQSRILFDSGVSTRISGPELVIFKAGYGGWRFDPEAAYRMLLGAGAIIEMEPLHSREERVAYQAGMGNLAERRGVGGQGQAAQVALRRAPAIDVQRPEGATVPLRRSDRRRTGPPRPTLDAVEPSPTVLTRAPSPGW